LRPANLKTYDQIAAAKKLTKTSTYQNMKFHHIKKTALYLKLYYVYGFSHIVWK